MSEEKRIERMSLEEAKEMFINPYWADMSGNIQPLCLCFQPNNATKYEKEQIPFASNIVKGTDPSGNACKVILCSRCLEYNIEYQKNLQNEETMTNEKAGGLYIPVDKDLFSDDNTNAAEDGKNKNEDGDHRIQGGNSTPPVEDEKGGKIHEKGLEKIEEGGSGEEIQI